MNTLELIYKLLVLGWEPAPDTRLDDSDFYLRKEFEVSNSNELENYTNYTPKEGEKVWIAYEVYPNTQIAHWSIWRDTDKPTEAPWDFKDYEEVVDLALQNMLFTYSE